MPFTRKVILRYLNARRGFTGVITTFSVVGIALGVAALIVVMSVMAGFRAELLDRILGVTGHVQVQEYGLIATDAQAMGQRLLRVPEVTSAAPYVLGQGMVLYNGKATGVLMRGVMPENLPDLKTATNGLPENLPDRGLVIGKVLADQLGVGLGDKITLLSPDGSRTIAGFIPRMLQVEIVGLFHIGQVQYDTGMVFMNLPTAQKFFKMGDGITALELMVAEPDKVQHMLPKLQKAAGDMAIVRTWVDNNRQFFQALEVERLAMFIILSLIVVVAAFNIITGQIMLVQDKASDIAILRTMGATRSQVLRIFLLNGLLLGGIGTLCGFIAGILLTLNLKNVVMGIEKLTGLQLWSSGVYFLDQIPSQIVWGDTLVIIGVSILLTLLASFYPAWRAARMNPVEVLRHA